MIKEGYKAGEVKVPLVLNKKSFRKLLVCKMGTFVKDCLKNNKGLH